MSALFVVFQMSDFVGKGDQEGVGVEVAVDGYLCGGMP